MDVGALPRVWVGPISREQVGARPQDRVDGCTGDGAGSTRRCREFAAKTSLGSIAAQIEGPFVVCAFSAGGQTVKAWSTGLAEEVRDRIAAMFLFDAIYESQGEGYADPGLLEWCLRAAQGRVWFIATSSANPNKNDGSGIQVAAWLREAVTRTIGEPWTEIPGIELPGLTPPEAVHRLGQAVFLDWPSYKHAKHPIMLAPVLLGLDLAAVFGTRAPSTASSAPTWSLVIGVGAAALCALGLTFYARRPRDPRPRDLLPKASAP